MYICIYVYIYIYIYMFHIYILGALVIGKAIVVFESRK